MTWSFATAGSRARGAMPARMPPPSSGGTGSRLKTARIRFSRTLSVADERQPAEHVDGAPTRCGLKLLGSRSPDWKSNANARARTTFAAGPAADTMAMPRRPLLSRRGSTGTGFPQPKADDEEHDRSGRVEVSLGVEGEAPQASGGEVALPVGGEGVGELVECDADQERG